MARMSRSCVSTCCALAIVASISDSEARAAAPNSCSFLTPAVVAAAIGQPVTGGTQSVVNDPSSSNSSCMYRAGSLLIVLSVNQLPSAAAARTEYEEELSNSRAHDSSSSAQKTASVSGLGDAAFSAADGPAISLTGLRGGATVVPQERLRTLLQTALNH